MNPGRLKAILQKEVIHIVRDPRSLFIIFCLPVLMIFIFGYAIDLNLKEVNVAVCDLSNSELSREITSKLTGSGYFVVSRRFTDPSYSEELLLKNIAQMVLIFPRDMEKRLSSGEVADVGVVIDGSNSNTASLIQGNIENFFASISSNAGRIRVKPVMLYNPDMKSSNFIVPGLVALIMMMLGALLTSITIAREKETGTLEQILVSPIAPAELIVGKVMPYLLLAVVIAAIVIGVGRFLFGVPIEGSLVDLSIMSVLYLFTALSIGLAISAAVGTQQVAMMLSLFITVLPSVMLSGFIFPIESMPLVLRVISRIVPATHYLVIIRGVLLKGNTLAELWKESLSLFAISAVLLVFSIRRFRMKLSEGV